MTVGLVVLGWMAGWVLFGLPKKLRPPARRSIPARIPTDQSAAPWLSIVIPARDEEHTLPMLLGDLALARPVGAEVLVVDDQSSDGTCRAALAHDFVRLVRADAPPLGWGGKSWACHVGASEARGSVLCFLDADVRVGIGALDSVADQLRLRGGLVSVQPWHRTEQPYEQASALFNVVAMMGTGAGRRGPTTGAFGPVLMTHVDDYRAVGGHRAVRGELVEDMAIASRYRDAGRAVTVLLGGELLQFRMYDGGPADVLEGWTKNFASGAAGTPKARLVAVVAWVVAMGTPVMASASPGSAGKALAMACLYLAFVVQLRTMFSVVGSFGWVSAFAYPLLLAVFLVVFTRSLWFTVVRGEVRWRGRMVPVGLGRGR